MLVLHGIYEKGKLALEQNCLPNQDSEAEVILLSKESSIKKGWKRVVKKIEIKKHDCASRFLEEERDLFL